MAGSFCCPRCQGRMTETQLVCTVCVLAAQRRVEVAEAAQLESLVPPPPSQFHRGSLRAALATEAGRLASGLRFPPVVFRRLS
jgi:hypothetical protein